MHAGKINKDVATKYVFIFIFGLGGQSGPSRSALVYPTIGTTLFRNVLFVAVLVETRAC